MNDENKKQEEEIDFDKQESIMIIRSKRKLLEEEISKDLKINTSNLIEECKNAPNVIQKYLELFSQYRRILNSKQITLEKKEAEWFGYYKSLIKKQDHQFGTHFPRDFNSTDAKRMISREKDYILVNAVVEELKDTVQYLEDVVRNFRDRQFQIKNIIDLMKLEQGGSREG